MSELTTLPELSFGRDPVPAQDVGTRGELRWIPLSKLRIDASYQRSVLDNGKANIRRMVEEFSWLLFGVVIVGARPGGLYAIIDGQHRTIAAKLHGGIEQIPCLVLNGGPADEAMAFGGINGYVTRIHALQSFRAKVRAGDRAAVELVELVARAGVKIAPCPTTLRPGETMGLGAIQNARRRHGEKNLLAGLKLLRAADPSAGISATAILGAVHAMDKNPDLAPCAEQHGANLHARGGIEPIEKRAMERKGMRGGAVWANFSPVLVEAIRLASRAGSIPLSRMMAGR